MRFILLTVLAFAVMPVAAQASPTPQMPECTITGKVEAIEERTEDISNRGRPVLPGQKRTQDYIDVTLAVTDVAIKEESPFGECAKEQIQTFQLGYKVKKPAIGNCIKALTNLSGDEFRIGNWIKDYELLKPGQCIENAQEKNDD